MPLHSQTFITIDLHVCVCVCMYVWLERYPYLYLYLFHKICNALINSVHKSHSNNFLWRSGGVEVLPTDGGLYDDAADGGGGDGGVVDGAYSNQTTVRI